MNNPLQAMLQAAVIPTSAFPPDSRYYGSGTLSYRLPDGRVVAYLQRRRVPPPGDFATLGAHSVVEGDRPDLLASTYLADPVLYWRLCDANAVLDPGELTDKPGSTVRLTLPQGVPGVPNVT